ncbi:MAG: transketolase [Bdellovibrionales bacterium]|nr:transketolase [Bdellovibrionales bacterium]
MQSSRELAVLAQEFRIPIIEMLTEAKSGHPGGSLSMIDLLTALWFGEMKGVDSAKSLDADRDHFILSKGHGVPALYAILAKKGFIEEKELMTLRKTGSRLQGHPDRVRLPIVEASTGSLGQGLSVAQGMAMGLKLDGKKGRVFCVLGDGEIQEGQVWEAALSAPKFGLSNLCAILDANGGQIDGPVSEVMPLEPLKQKWESFGWKVVEIDGHNMDAILGAYAEFRKHHDSGAKQPFFILARTVKGKGVSFMENQIGWHGVVPKPEERDRAIGEIKTKLAEMKGGK